MQPARLVRGLAVFWQANTLLSHTIISTASATVEESLITASGNREKYEYNRPYTANWKWLFLAPWGLWILAIITVRPILLREPSHAKLSLTLFWCPQGANMLCWWCLVSLGQRRNTQSSRSDDRMKPFASKWCLNQGQGSEDMSMDGNEPALRLKSTCQELFCAARTFVLLKAEHLNRPASKLEWIPRWENYAHNKIWIE